MYCCLRIKKTVCLVLAFVVLLLLPAAALMRSAAAASEPADTVSLPIIMYPRPPPAPARPGPPPASPSPQEFGRSIIILTFCIETCYIFVNTYKYFVGEHFILPFKGPGRYTRGVRTEA